MSDYHGLDVSSKFNRIRIAIHTNTPNGANIVGFPYSTALVEMLTMDTGEPPVSIVPWLQAEDAIEYGLITAGEVLETVESVEFDANASQGAKVQAMNDYVEQRIPEITQQITKRLEYWGSNRDIPTA